MSDHNPHNPKNMPDPQNSNGGTGVPPVSPASGESGADRLDALLAAWHAANTERARAGRDKLLASLSTAPTDKPQAAPGVRVHERTRSAPTRRPPQRPWIRRFLMNRYSPMAAALIALLVVGVMLLPTPSSAVAQVTSVMAPDGGRLDALDADGNVVGPCTLKRTDVRAEVSGCLLRVTVKQTYTNPFADKIEAVYTFPLSHKAAVDRMTMTIGSRVVEGEVKERELARQIYEAARDAGRIASLLEQERPNIFTQSVANIEPKASIIVEISYVELLEPVNGQYSFVFPTTVGPRYIPGGTMSLHDNDVPIVIPGMGTGTTGPTVPTGIKARRGLVLNAPGRVTLLPDSPAGTVTPKWLELALNNTATPVRVDATYTQPEVIATFRVAYPDGSAEFGSLRSDGVGEVAGRWFLVTLPRSGSETSAAPNPGSPFASPTTQVPDADKITPMPVRPDQRAGHDISISVSLDTGGPGLSSISSPSHTVTGGGVGGGKGAVRATVELAKANEIPNKDFVLTWSTAGSGIQEGVFTHSGVHGNFFSVILEPPARVEPDQIVPRELCFVLDTSGSMNGWPIDKSKELMTKAIGQMRPSDTFNVITFAGTTEVLWKSPRPANAANIAEAQTFVGGKSGGGGTEMMTAINAALEQKPIKGRVRPLRTVVFLTDAFVGNDMAIIDAIRKNRGTTRVFSLGVGNSVNRYLIDGMAAAGGGESEVVLLDQNADAAVDRLTRRIQSPVLTDIALEFSGNLAVTDVLPADEQGHLPDLYDMRPLVLTGRYTAPGSGTLIIRGNTGAGPYERSINVTLPPIAQGSDAIATLWARAKVDSVTSKDLKGLQEGNFPLALKDEVITLGETFQIMTPFTSFVAVDKLSVTVNGKPRLVHVPIELPAGTAWEGFFGGMAAGTGGDADDETGRADGLLISAGVTDRLSSLGATRGRIASKEEEKKLDATLAVKGTKGALGTTGDATGAQRGGGTPPPPPPPGKPGAVPVPSAAPAAPASAAAPAAPAEPGLRRASSKSKLANEAQSGGPGGGPADNKAGQPAAGGAGGGPAFREGVQYRYIVPTDGRREAGERERALKDSKGYEDSAGVPVDFYNGGCNSVPEVYSELFAGDDAARTQFIELYKASPLKPDQLRLLGISGVLTPEDQLATGRVPAAHMIRAAALANSAAGMKAVATVFAMTAPGDPVVGELNAAAGLIEAKDAKAAESTQVLATKAGSGLETLYKALKLVQTVERGLLQKARQMTVDKSPASHEFAVVVLVSAADKATLEAIKAAGLKIDFAEPEQRVLIGRVTLGDLEQVALLDAVRRIEPDR